MNKAQVWSRKALNRTSSSFVILTVSSEAVASSPLPFTPFGDHPTATFTDGDSPWVTLKGAFDLCWKVSQEVFLLSWPGLYTFFFPLRDVITFTSEKCRSWIGWNLFLKDEGLSIQTIHKEPEVLRKTSTCMHIPSQLSRVGEKYTSSTARNVTFLPGVVKKREPCHITYLLLRAT